MLKSEKKKKKLIPICTNKKKTNDALLYGRVCKPVWI